MFLYSTWAPDLSYKSILPDSEKHHVCLVSVGQTGEEIFLPFRGNLDGIGDYTSGLLFCDWCDLFTRNGKLQYSMQNNC